MITIWKFTLTKVHEEFVVPLGHLKPLCVQWQDKGWEGHDKCVWFEVEDYDGIPTALIEVFQVCTGARVPSHAMYIGTIQEGPMVYHVYYKRK